MFENATSEMTGIDEVATRYPLPQTCDDFDVDRDVEVWQEEARRQLADLQMRVRHLEVIVHRLLNESTGDGR